MPIPDRQRSAAEGRRALDRALQPVRGVRIRRPPRGWIRAIRNALGMTAEQLAARVGVSQPTIQRLEMSEASDSIQLKTLRRLAEALDCELVYALVPRRPLQVMFDEQARAAARRELRSVGHTMALEDQALSAEEGEDLLERYIAEELDPRRVWALRR